MKVAVRFFASLREALGPGESVDAGAATDIGSLRKQLAGRGGRYAEVLGPDRPVRSARNRLMSAETTPLAEGDEIGFFPPVTGG